MTSLDMAGLNFTILKLTDQVRRWVDAPTEMLGWPPITTPGGTTVPKSSFSKTNASKEESHIVCEGLTSLKCAVTFVCESLFAAEIELNDLDAITGDGDCGSTVKLGAEG